MAANGSKLQIFSINMRYHNREFQAILRRLPSVWTRMELPTRTTLLTTSKQVTWLRLERRCIPFLQLTPSNEVMGCCWAMKKTSLWVIRIGKSGFSEKYSCCSVPRLTTMMKPLTKKMGMRKTRVVNGRRGREGSSSPRLKPTNWKGVFGINVTSAHRKEKHWRCR